MREVDLLEVSDWIVDYDPHTLERRPVDKGALLRRLREDGEREAATIVASLPDKDGALSNEHVDALLVRVHCELQRLWEEFEQGARLRGAPAPLVPIARRAGRARFRGVAVGCGLGFCIRSIPA